MGILVRNIFYIDSSSSYSISFYFISHNIYLKNMYIIKNL